jgi:predicted RNA binding protein YcfA (HicA-like mRNA interferase family)
MLNGNLTTVPQHTDIKEGLCRKICKDLDLPDILK